MGLIYNSADSSSVRDALSANLAAATSVLDATQKATGHLTSRLVGGQLSGKGYSAVRALFASVIAPCITDARNELESVRGDLEKFTAEDSKISAFGVLKEDELKKQLAASKRQRDATVHQIDVNRVAADSSTAVPGLSEALTAKNVQLELVLDQLKTDVRDLEGRIQALQQFDSATKGLFLDRLDNLAAVTGDTIALLNQLDNTKIRLSVAGTLGSGVGALATRRDILNFLGDKQLTKDAQGRVRWGERYLFESNGLVQKGFIFRQGNRFNEATGVRIDHYRQPIGAGVRGLASPVDDFHGWKDASKIGKLGKGLGAAGTLLTVAGNADTYFRDGAQEYDGADFAVDTGVDLASAAVSAGVGAVAGSFFLPPLGTVVGAGVGLFVGVVLDLPLWGGASATDAAKDAMKKAYR
ncbi:hypothetical protein [Leifsonia shinshuensis]|uniref:LXG domain-containing protein n=1 Tax=Leifsonia shinshuensis TaxID=150026 RepID=A0A7G6YFG6_9MICO|nr:hypothetical protein [Leifsonia shinshuensis]QNE37231.1 hypothetical protein F1C12_20335 [Leifsonia shinshuensis]